MTIFSNVTFDRVLDILGQFTQWVQEGLGLLLPAFWQNRFWRPVTQIIDVDTGMSQRSRRLMQHSWVATRRVVPVKELSVQSECPVTVSLSPQQIFKTEISFPNAAKGDLQSAIRLRLNELSPIPVDQARFDYRVSGSDGPERFLSEIIITKSSHIDRAREVVTVPEQAVRVGHLTEEGHLFVFEKETTASARPIIQKIKKHFPIWLGITLCLIAIPLFLSRQTTALEDRQQALIQNTKDLKARTANLEEILTGIALDQPKGSHQLSEALSDIESDLPTTALVETIVFKENQLILTGYMPEDPAHSRQGVAYPYQLRASNRPGFKRFTMRRAVKESN